jgi:hypothetical protein
MQEIENRFNPAAKVSLILKHQRRSKNGLENREWPKEPAIKRTY